MRINGLAPSGVATADADGVGEGVADQATLGDEVAEGDGEAVVVLVPVGLMVAEALAVADGLGVALTARSAARDGSAVGALVPACSACRVVGEDGLGARVATAVGAIGVATCSGGAQARTPIPSKAAPPRARHLAMTGPSLLRMALARVAVN